MVRIAGVTIPDNKKIEISLSYVYGIGRPVARKILARTKISDTKRAKDLSADEVAKLRDVIEKEYTVEGALRREIMQNIKRLRDIGSYRGTRHLRGLPARGQRTKTNSRTHRGNVRKTMGSGKRKLDKK
mgnify:FL=1